MDRNDKIIFCVPDKIKSMLQKIRWLIDIVLKCVDMNRFANNLSIKDMDSKLKRDLSFIVILEDKLKVGRKITKSDMQICNGILDELKSKYQFTTDWRGDIVDCALYTKYKLYER